MNLFLRMPNRINNELANPSYSGFLCLFFWLVSILLGLVIVLEYGFTQVGFRLGNVPVPLTEVMLALLLYLYVLFRPYAAVQIPLPGWLLLFVVVYSLFKFQASFSEWGGLALRDMSHFVEILAFFLGLWMFRDSSVGHLRILWLVISGAVVIYGSFYPFRFALQQLSPKVTLLKTVPLLGSMSGVGQAVTAALFVTLLNMKHPARYAFGALALFVLAYVQARGLYLAVPLALLTALLLGRWPDRLHLLKGILVSLGIGLLALKILIPIVPAGRIGEISPEFAWEHLKTAFGAEGPAAGSVEHRRRMIHYTLGLVADTQGAWLFGIGMGVDLIGGAEGGSDPSIRKPHDDYLEVYGRLGLIGLVPWVLAILIILWRLVWACRRLDVAVARRLALSWVCMAVIYLFIATTQPLLSYPYGAVPLYALLGMAWGLQECLSGSRRLASCSSVAPVSVSSER